MAIKELTIPIDYAVGNEHYNNDGAVVTPTISVDHGTNVFLHWSFDPQSYVNADKEFLGIHLNIYINSTNINPTFNTQFKSYLKREEAGQLTYSTTWMTDGVTDESLKVGWNKILIGFGGIIFNSKDPKSRFRFTLSPTDVFTFNSHTASSNKPFINIGYSEISPPNPILKNLSPTWEVTPTVATVFSWEHNIDKVGQQKSFVLEYTDDDWVTTETIAETTSRQSYTVPAKTFDGDKIVKWRVKITGEYWDTESDFATASFRTTSTKPYVTGLSPNGGVVDSRNPILVRWTHNSTVHGIQEGFALEYSTDNETWQTITETTSRQSYTFTPMFFDGEVQVNWRVKTIDSIFQNESNFYTASFMTGITAQRPPTILAPYSEYLDVADNINFEWIFRGHPGEYQSKYELNWSRNGGSTWFEIINESSNDYHVILGNTFTTGTITWRIRTWNNYDEISPWSEVKSFYLIGRPATPVITDVSNNTKPIVKWTADSQQIFELDILQGGTVIYTSGKVASISTFQHYVDRYLANETYKARLRVKNQYDLWSAYGERNFTIDRENPDDPAINVTNGEFKVTITATGLSNKSYVYRDNYLLGEMINGVYEDYTGVNNKEYNYIVRTINEEENFSDSNSKIGNCSFRGNTLALEKNPSVFLLLRFNLSNKPDKSIEIGADGELMKFDGREYDTFEFDDSISLSKTLRFNIEDEQLKKLEQLIKSKSILIYRDHFGENIYGVVQKATATKSVLGYVVEFTINKVKEV